MTMTIKKYVMGVFSLNQSKEEKTHLCAMYQMAQEEKFKSPIPYKNKTKKTHPV